MPAGCGWSPGAASGVALITVDAAGENSIAVAAGANGRAGPDEVAAAFAAPCEALVALGRDTGRGARGRAAPGPRRPAPHAC